MRAGFKTLARAVIVPILLATLAAGATAQTSVPAPASVTTSAGAGTTARPTDVPHAGDNRDQLKLNRILSIVGSVFKLAGYCFVIFVIVAIIWKAKKARRNAAAARNASGAAPDAAELSESDFANPMEAARRRGESNPVGMLLLFGIAFTGFAAACAAVYFHRKNPGEIVAGIAALAFACVGIPFLVAIVVRLLRHAAWRRRAAAAPDEPWVGDYRWDPTGCTDTRRGKVAGMWLKAAIFAVILAPANFYLISHFARMDPIFLIVGVIFLGLFDIGFFTMARSAWRASAEKARFGAAQLNFKRFPFFLGDRCDMSLENEKGIAHFDRLVFTLRFVREQRVKVVERDSDGASVSYKMTADQLWAQKVVLDKPGDLPAGKPVPISFQLPAGANFATHLGSDQPQYWELVVSGKTDGPDYHERFLVPVYADPNRPPEPASAEPATTDAVSPAATDAVSPAAKDAESERVEDEDAPESAHARSPKPPLRLRVLRVLAILGLVLAVMWALLLAPVFYTQLYILMKSDEYRRTDFVVTSVREVRPKHGQESYYAIGTVDGNEEAYRLPYTVRVGQDHLQQLKEQYPAGTIIKVLYNPTAHDISVMGLSVRILPLAAYTPFPDTARGRVRWVGPRMFIPLGLAIAFMLAVWLRIRKWRRTADLSAEDRQGDIGLTGAQPGESGRIRARCRHCGIVFGLPDSAVGTQVKCPVCNAVLSVPGAPPSAGGTYGGEDSSLMTPGKTVVVALLVCVIVVACVVLYRRMKAAAAAAREEAQRDEHAGGPQEKITPPQWVIDRAMNTPRPPVAMAGGTERIFVPDAAHAIGLGMSLKTIAAVLGEPQVKSPTGTIASYGALGVSIWFRQDKAFLIAALGHGFGYADQGVMGVPFKGETSRGIKLGATSAEIVAKYGAPDMEGGGWESWDRELTYLRMRIKFTLTQDHVEQIDLGEARPSRGRAMKPNAAARALTLVPLQGAAELKFGASPEEAAALLGEPEATESLVNNVIVQHYHAHGLALKFEDWRLSEIHAYAAQPASFPNADGYQGFAGQLDGGFRMGATEAEVAAKFPTVVAGVTDYGFAQLKIVPLDGVILSYWDGKLAEITVNACKRSAPPAR